MKVKGTGQNHIRIICPRLAISVALSIKFAEVGFAMHARAAADEFKEHADDFITLADKTTVKTPNIDKLRSYFS